LCPSVPNLPQVQGKRERRQKAQIQLKNPFFQYRAGNFGAVFFCAIIRDFRRARGGKQLEWRRLSGAVLLIQTRRAKNA